MTSGTTPPESAISYDCGGAPQVAILHRSAERSTRGVLFVVAAGPQYRVGGHRQAVQWARQLAQSGYHAFRFDYRGVGDSAGPFLGFEHIDEDLRCAVEEFVRHVPELREVVLWGECSAATAIAFYAYQDPRVKATVLLNPWVRTEAVQAQAIVRHYYWQRLREPSFWKKVLSLKFNPVTAGASAVRNVIVARRGAGRGGGSASKTNTGPIPRDWPLPDAVRVGLERFRGRVLTMMSGRDNIAREFDEVVAGSTRWNELLSDPRFSRVDFPEADHTFSTTSQKREVIETALQWLGKDVDGSVR